MLNQNIVLLKNDTEVIDITDKLTDIGHVGYTATIEATHAIYIGSVLPFNSIFFSMGPAVNTEAATMKVAYWSGTQFVDFIRVKDGSNALGQSGLVSFIAKNTQGPARYDANRIAEIGVDGYYGYYWTKITFDIDLEETEIKYIGYSFLTADSELYDEYADLSNTDYMKIWSTSKTTWENQRIVASDRVIADLMTNGLIVSADQLLDYRLLKQATIHKCAALIYAGLGNRYTTDREAAESRYSKAIKVNLFAIDNGASLQKSVDCMIPKGSYFTR